MTQRRQAKAGSKEPTPRPPNQGEERTRTSLAERGTSRPLAQAVDALENVDETRNELERRNHKTLGVKTLWSSSHSHKQVVWLVKASSSSAEPTASRPKKGGGKNQHKLGRAREKWPFYTSSQQALHTLERVGERRLWETKQVGREGTTRQ